MSTKSGFPDIGEIFFALCKAVDTPKSLAAWIMFKSNQLDLARLAIDSKHYQTASSFRSDYLVVEFLSKWKGLNTGLDLEAEALKGFTSSEEQCKATNQRIIESRSGPIDQALSSIISMAKRKISRLVGVFDWSVVHRGYGWGNGATASIPRRRAFLDTKMCEVPFSCTPSARSLFAHVVGTDLHWSASILGVDIGSIAGPYCLLDDSFLLQEESIIDLVPKNAKTHRVIAKEATANGFLQKGFGLYFRNRLKRVGVNLDDQSLNQDAARRAYGEGLATIDKKAASDTVSKELVYELFPLDWAFALDSVRSRRAILPDGTSITLQKWSSMGNGYTFELESIIFWALASSVMEWSNVHGTLCVYGDDVVLPSSCANLYVGVLAFAGFTVNLEKTHIEGCFFESCGKHYFKGEDVTPVYQKELVDSVSEHIRLTNRLIRWSLNHSDGKLCHPLTEGAWKLSLRAAGRRFPFLPLGTEGDDGFLLPADYFPITAQCFYRGLKCNVVRYGTRRLPANERPYLAWKLRSLGSGNAVEGPFRFQVGLYIKDDRVPFDTGHVNVDIESDSLSSGVRWVMPNGDFGISYGISA
ncbi:RNA-directed RNA polymerase [ssRNA phage Gerhypos.1_48]|uniref:RNA-directed RNA polymerase n=2 Tax=Fiersviridae TaxID=2842319 RepID=A0A8S5L0V0_9VIRU|nr:RNA-directed RNA polymerase [ssRNA phage Gerhypos.1_48]QDH90595.1 MAG: RNA-dependent RNA polymerase [Leviviridae sp.]DAD51534.1 TPA_asm: RNA-directed RNA polymerase [ssRNA phage Gerhypos.1_48]